MKYTGQQLSPPDMQPKTEQDPRDSGNPGQYMCLHKQRLAPGAEAKLEFSGGAA